MVLHLEVKLLVRSDDRVIDQKNDDQLLVLVKYGVGRQLDFPPRHHVRPFPELVRPGGLAEHRQPVRHHHRARGQLAGLEIGHAQRPAQDAG